MDDLFQFSKLSIWCLAPSRSLSAPEFTPIARNFEQAICAFLRVDAEVNHGRAAAVWPGILHKCYPALQALGLTECLLRLLLRGYMNQNSGSPFDFAEIFAGRGNLSKEFLRAGYKGSAFDLCFSDDHDCLTIQGMRLMLEAITSLKKKGMLWIATQCSSFVVLCRAQSRRNESNNYLGDLQRSFVLMGNALAEASSMFFFLAYVLGIYVILENPMSSVIDKCPSLCGCFQFVQPWCFTTYMGAFFGRSVKPLKLWSTLREIQGLECDRPSGGGDDELVRRHGPDSQQFTGNHQLLQESEVYTPQFGKAVVRIFQNVWNNL